MTRSHTRARQIVTSLDHERDDQRHGELLRYIDHQEALDHWSNDDVVRIANAADRRSHEAMARTITLASDLTALSAALLALDDDNCDLRISLKEIEREMATLAGMVSAQSAR